MQEKGETQHQKILREVKEQCEYKCISALFDFITCGNTSITFILNFNKKEDNTCLQKSLKRN